MRRPALALLVLLLATPAWGQEATARLGQRKLALGRSTELTVEVRVPAGSAYQPPEADTLKLPPFEVLDAVRVALPPEEGARLWRYTLRLAAYEPGKLVVPSLDFGGARTTPFEVEVREAPPDPPGQIRGLKGPLAPAGWLGTLAAALALGLGGAALAGWLVHRFMPRRALTPEQRYLAALEAPGTPGVRLAAVGDAVRGRLAHLHGKPLQKLTTAEIEAEVELSPALRALLEEADLAKFARHEPAAGDLERHLGTARGLVSR